MTDAPRVSVCVSTRDRGPLLRRLLDALAAQTVAPGQVEVLVVDDGSKDETAAVLDAARRTFPLRLQVFRHETAQGPAAGRNRAWRAARGELVAFTDDDCVPTAGWLAALLAASAGQPRVVVGRVEPAEEQRHRHDPFAHTWVMRAAEVGWFATANVAYRRADLERLGGFDERYRNPACEDTDLGLRAEESGLEVVFAPDALVWHDVRPGTVADKVRDAARWGDLPLLVRSHPGARRRLLAHRVFWKPSHLDLLLLAAACAALPRRPAAGALALPWLHRRLCPAAGAPEADLPMPARVALLPALLAVDAAELTAMMRGSWRHRFLVL